MLEVDRHFGIKLGIVGLFVAIVGLVLFFIGATGLGYWVASAGVAIGFGGGVVHFLRNWREIFRVEK
ncbi:MAG TPA: hypothetical protein VD932_05970 [Aquabacterium sp.]|nr:hypothetical protein [Aquabacterium sp.]